MIKPLLASILVLILTITFVNAAPVVSVGNPAPSFELKDQFGKSWSLTSLKGNVVVLVGANSDSGRAMGPWVDKLHARYGNKIQLLGLLDLHDIPGIGRGIAKAKIRRETKDPLMLDFNGDISKAYAISGKAPVVVVIDKDSSTKSIQRGQYTKAGFDAITSAVEKALKADATK